ncbi:hypothetical protein GCM10011611_64270 [Aliidongia dinghuensis]|uniref:Uncharacterized protein n=1 Tax=Aliidongia dinghuensis TaxID=1867774 RepID=A0A8J2Z222_9PROT|nr:hypothetical protein [Aliidongia dinghuensis]GGF49035.1 hypothetical protein GCM10011611_64270 [Aliidongia dinghuensis]
MTGFGGQMDLLIDQTGQPWPNGSTALRRYLGQPSSTADLAGFVVCNLGFARLRIRQGTILLSVRAGQLEFRALEAVVRFLVTETWQRLVIEHMDRRPDYEIFGRVEDAVARLKDLSAPSVALAPRDPFFSQELSLDRLAQSGQQSLQSLLALWRARRGQLAPNQIIAMMPGPLKSRMVLTRMHRPDSLAPSRALVEHIGSGFRVFDACWALGAVGRDLEQLPDPGYGERSARAYHEVAALGQPRFEHVDAVIDVPGRPVTRSRYERLMLPWRSRGELFVCGASVLRSSYPLEPAAAQAVRS